MNIDDVRASTFATITIKDAAELVGVDARTLTAELDIHGGSIPARRIGRRVLLPREAFLRWLDGDAPTAVPQTEPAVPKPDKVAIVRGKLVELLGALDDTEQG